MTKSWIVDLDAIGADIYTDWLRTVNHEFGTNLTVADLKEWDFTLMVAEEHRKYVKDMIRRKGFFRNLKPLPGFVESIKELLEHGDDLLIATAADSDAPWGASEKLEWIHEHLPFFPRRSISVMHRKEWLQADGIIDDAPTNISAYRKRHPQAQVVTIAYPFNEGVAHHCNLRADGWNDTASAWKQIVAYLKAQR